MPAPHGLRLAAWLIDWVIVFLLFRLALPKPSDILLLILLIVAYHTAFLWLTGATIGKAILGLRVIRSVGKPPLFWALGRSGLGYFIVDVFGVGMLASLFDRHRRCFHDRVFGSTVVRQRTEALSAKTASERLSWLSGELQESLKQKRGLSSLAGLVAFLEMLAARLNQILTPVLEKLGIAPGTSTAPQTSVGTGSGIPATASGALGAKMVTQVIVLIIATGATTNNLVPDARFTVAEFQPSGETETVRLSFQGHRYRLTPKSMPANQAEAYAQDIAGHLVTIDSLEEQSFLTEALRGRGRLWIGYTDAVAEGKWIWNASGEEGNYTYWCGGEPNNQGEEDHAVMLWGDNGCWNDWLGNIELYGIVELN